MAINTPQYRCTIVTGGANLVVQTVHVDGNRPDRSMCISRTATAHGRKSTWAATVIRPGRTGPLQVVNIDCLTSWCGIRGVGIVLYFTEHTIIFGNVKNISVLKNTIWSATPNLLKEGPGET
jgi:hypothetical protein